MTLRDLVKENEKVLDSDIFVDCLEGDKFLVSNIEFNGNSLTLKLHKGDRRWIKISEHYQRIA